MILAKWQEYIEMQILSSPAIEHLFLEGIDLASKPNTVVVDCTGIMKI